MTAVHEHFGLSKRGFVALAACGVFVITNGVVQGVITPIMGYSSFGRILRSKRNRRLCRGTH